MENTKSLDTIATFPSSIGWFAMVGSGQVLKQLTFGHATPEAAIRALDAALVDGARIGTWNRPLVRRLQAYADGARDDFGDVLIDAGLQTDFQRRVYQRCRRINYGRTLSYGELAARVGRPRAAVPWVNAWRPIASRWLFRAIAWSEAIRASAAIPPPPVWPSNGDCSKWKVAVLDRSTW